jgi:hypothetical protein
MGLSDWIGLRVVLYTIFSMPLYYSFLPSSYTISVPGKQAWQVTGPNNQQKNNSLCQKSRA